MKEKPHRIKTAKLLKRTFEFLLLLRDNQHDTLYLKLMWECGRASSKFNVYTYVQVVRRRLHLETLGPRLEGVQVG